MREIKFRAWDKVRNNMVDIDFIGESFFKPSGYEVEFMGCEEFVVMQFTGLKDPSGKTVCEGDVVDWIDGEYSFRGIVVIGAWSFYIKGIDPKDNFNFEDYSDRDETDLWVVGNIYENPELLEGAN